MTAGSPLHALGARAAVADTLRRARRRAVLLLQLRAQAGDRAVAERVDRGDGGGAFPPAFPWAPCTRATRTSLAIADEAMDRGWPASSSTCPSSASARTTRASCRSTSAWRSAIASSSCTPGTMPYRDPFTGLDGFRGVMARFPALRVIVAHLGAFDTGGLRGDDRGVPEPLPRHDDGADAASPSRTSAATRTPSRPSSSCATRTASCSARTSR